MLPWLLVDTATVPGGGGEMKLMRRGDEFAIRVDNRDLMNSRFSGSEKALADVACERIRGRRKCSVLIGGFGMGFTLRAALARLGPDARIVVAELVPAVVAWARGPMAALSAPCLADPRVTIRSVDVREPIAAAPSGFNAILLDVDNGPDGLTRSGNDALYTVDGLRAARRALRPGGVLAVWSAAPSKAFNRRLGHAGFAVEEIIVRANGAKGARHVIWLATRAEAPRR